jgi:serine/threonine protein kinase/regulator of sirC expression with transglutaminase-like and TPR domain
VLGGATLLGEVPLDGQGAKRFFDDAALDSRSGAGLPPAPSTPAAPSTLGSGLEVGPYRLLSEIGRGGGGVVFRARSAAGEEVALKVLAQSGLEAFARFDRERRLLASLGADAGFVPLLDAGRDAAGRFFLVMPFVAGGTLRDRLRRGPLEVPETVELGTALARALARAHERGIVHRDLKPENVMFDAAGRPLVADLGLAKHFREDAAGASQSVSFSRSGGLGGTAGYMPREQMHDAKNAGPAADVFALGAILHECLSGEPAFLAPSAPDLLALVEEGIVARLSRLRSDVPEGLERVLLRALACEPGERYQDGRELLVALEGRSRRSRRLLALGALVLLFAASVAVTVLSTRSDAPPVASSRPAPGPLPTKPDALELEARAMNAVEKGDLQGAIDYATKALDLDPKRSRAWQARASARGQRHELPGAIADATNALELDPSFAAAWAMRGMAKMLQGDMEGAAADATRALQLDPRLAQAWCVRAVARMQERKSDAAIEDATRSIELDPKQALAFEVRAMARRQKKDDEGAIADYTKELELVPNTPGPYANRALSREAKGDIAGAIADCERFLELAPEHPKAPEIRAQLEALRKRR